MRAKRKLSRREVESEFPGAIHELPYGEEPEFTVLQDDWDSREVLSVRFADNNTYSWNSSRGWVSEP